MQKHSTTEVAIGQKRGRWTVIQQSSRPKYWLCRCECGNEKEVLAWSLRYAVSLSCGCYHDEIRKAGTNTRHGRVYTREYRSYWGMKQRCYQESSTARHNYADRGITVCARWLESFENFFADMGPCPSKTHSVDRKDNNSGYFCGKPECPDCGPLHREPNCRWATPTEQARNTRRNRLIEFQGRTQTIAGWSSETGLTMNCIGWRLKQGWTIEAALTIPSSNGGWGAARRTPERFGN
jgi:hypothetical protein